MSKAQSNDIFCTIANTKKAQEVELKKLSAQELIERLRTISMVIDNRTQEEIVLAHGNAYKRLTNLLFSEYKLIKGLLKV